MKDTSPGWYFRSHWHGLGVDRHATKKDQRVTELADEYTVRIWDVAATDGTARDYFRLFSEEPYLARLLVRDSSSDKPRRRLCFRHRVCRQQRSGRSISIFRGVAFSGWVAFHAWRRSSQCSRLGLRKLCTGQVEWTNGVHMLHVIDLLPSPQWRHRCSC